MTGMSNSKQRQISGSSTNSGGLLRGLLTTNPGNAPVQMASSPMARSLLMPVRDSSSGARDSPTLQMMAGNGMNNNTNRNSMGGNTPGGGSLQPTPTRMVRNLTIFEHHKIFSSFYWIYHLFGFIVTTNSNTP